MKTRNRGWELGVVIALGLLVLALLPQAAYTEGPGTGNEDRAPVDGPDCANPPTGKRARLLGDSEMVWSARGDKYKNLSFVSLDDRDGKLSVISGLNEDLCQGDALTDIRWPSVTTADLNGDGKAQIVLAFRDKYNEVGATVVVPTGQSTPPNLHGWLSGSEANRAGKNVAWIDVAAGNLDGHLTGDKDDEVVIAFADQNQAIQVLTLDADKFAGHAATPTAAYVGGSDYGRSKVNYVAVATGDLDGDGYDNEIVAVFADGNKNLQAMIFQHSDAGHLKLLKFWTWQDHYRHPVARIGEHDWGNARPIDVTAGDIDGDYRDEAVIAFRDSDLTGNTWGQVQMLVLDAQGDKGYDDSTFAQRNPRSDISCYDPYPPSVSIAAGDLDGDGADEIALAYAGDCAGGGDVKAQLVTYEGAQFNQWGWPELTLTPRPGHWQKWVGTSGKFTSSSVQPWYYLVVGADDLDRDGNDEIALALTANDGELYVYSFDADSGLTQRGSYKTNWAGQNKEQEFWLAMGDLDGDSVYSTYTGKCYRTEDVYPSALVHAPPHWSADEHNSAHADADFKTAIQTERGEKQTSETGYGGSATFGVKFHEIGYSATYEYEKSVATEHEVLTATMESVGISTCPPYSCGDGAYYAAVGYHMCPRWCFEYKDDEDQSPITVCTPRPADECEADKAKIDYWYQTVRAKYPGSWVPVGMNLARGKPAEQSSTNYSGVAPRAVDGNTDGVYANASVTFAEAGPQPWWQVDLGISPFVQAVQLWNRTDAAPDRLSDFYVFLSDEEFSAQDTPGDIQGREGVWWYRHDGTVDEAFQGVPMRLQTIPWDAFRDHLGQPPESSAEVTGRYLRVQLAPLNGGNRQALCLAEVQVWGMPSEVDQWPVASPVPGSDSFTVKLRDGSQQTVAGQHVYSWQGAKLGVNAGGAASWSTGQDQKWEQAKEWSTAATSKLGVELVFIGGDYVMTSKEVKSRIMAWSKETEFSGAVGPVHADEDGYNYAPYVWLQRAQTSGGMDQALLVVDYWVPSLGASAEAASTAAPGGMAGVTPQAPTIDSPSHPDPEAWYAENVATFAWGQPAGDPALVTGYRWHLDQLSTTVPAPFSNGPARGQTYQGLRDGVWYLHARALGDNGEWSDTAHRAIRIDTEPPQVRLALDPPRASGQDGWYTTPLTVTVVTTDGLGSGVTAVEVSADGANWQAYTAPLRFADDTAATTLWARASDAAGHVSEPVSTTFKIDRTAPDSRTPVGPAPGALRAEVLLDAMGNEQLVLAGSIADGHAGGSGLDLRSGDLDWTSADLLGAGRGRAAQPGVEVHWAYTATTELGRGNHTFYGHAYDQAGHQEETHELASVVWFPQGAPDLVGSGMTAWPSAARPGEEVYFRISLRNQGDQEAWVQVKDTLPPGLAPVTEMLPEDVQYDAGTRTLTWPARLLWPGEWERFRFLARVDPGQGAAVLENRATAHAFWPNTAELPAADRKRFEDREQTVELAAAVTVDPGLPEGADATAPWAGLYFHSGHIVRAREVELGILAAADARWMYLREWVLDPATGQWVVAQNSGWVGYQPVYPWTLSPAAGVKYLGVWVADGAHNVSSLDEHSLAFTNLMGGESALADGQRQQYRFELGPSDLVIYNLVAREGDPDLYVWDPRHAFRPNHAAEANRLVDVLGLRLRERGLYLFEVLARGDSRYDLFHAQPGEVDLASMEAELASRKERPEHPLAISDPLSAGLGLVAPAVEIQQCYLPLIYRDR